MVPGRALRVAVDATPLLGHRTGVGVFVSAVLPLLGADPGLALSAYALSLRGGRTLPGHLPPGVVPLTRPMPAGALLAAWARADAPPGRWWTGRAVDVVHGTNFVTPPSAPGAEVVTVHDLTPVHHPQWTAPATACFPVLLRRAIARGALVHTPSAFVAAEVVEWSGVAPDRVVVVAHGVPPAPAGTSRAPVVDGRYVLALGTVEPRKDLPTLVRAFDHLAATDADLRLVLAGPPGWGQAALDAAADRAHHRDRIVRLGWVEPDDAAALLGGAAVLAFPSLYEGFGFPPLQAMAAGVPVVASRAGALPEVLSDGVHLVPPADADALAEGLALVLSDEDLRAALVARGTRRAASYTWTACAAALADLYRQAATATTAATNWRTA